MYKNIVKELEENTVEYNFRLGETFLNKPQTEKKKKEKVKKSIKTGRKRFDDKTIQWRKWQNTQIWQRKASTTKESYETIRTKQIL